MRPAPTLDKIDHAHVYVKDRALSEKWYADVLGFKPVKKYAVWAVDGGPLVIQNGGVHLALFESCDKVSGMVAFLTDKSGLMQWQNHLLDHAVEFTKEDHDLALSVYFADPDGNRYEITTYDVDE